MEPFEPIRETAEAFELLGPVASQVRTYMDDIVVRVQSRIPELVAVSLTLLDHEGTMTFTLAISDDLLRGLDAVQYLQGGPCVRAVMDDQIVTTNTDDPLDERQWSLFARGASRFGVRSSLSIPVHINGRTIGGLNVYAATADAFHRHLNDIAELVQASAAEAISDADLTFTAAERARQTLVHVQDLETLDVAAGLLAQKEDISEDAAMSRIVEAARRAGVATIELAVLVIEVAAEDQ